MIALTESTASFLATVHNTLGPDWFRTLAAELTAPDERLRMRDMGPCAWPGAVAVTVAPTWVPVERESVDAGVALAREIQQMRLEGGL